MKIVKHALITLGSGLELGLVLVVELVVELDLVLDWESGSKSKKTTKM